MGDVAEVQNGYAFKSSDFKDSGIPIIKIKNVSSGKLQMFEVDYYQSSIDELEKFIIEKDDILIAMTGSHVNQPSSMVGKVARYNLNSIALLNQRVGKIYSIDSTILNEDFLFYFLKQNDVTYELALNAGGSANQANISPELIKSLDIFLFPLQEQCAIASVLSSLDDKIDLLHRQNKTLEAMAETLFRQWFVEEADEGWEEKPLSFYGEIICGKTPSKRIQSYFNGNIPFIKIPDMHGNVFIFDTDDSLTEEGKQSQLNKTLPPKSICVSCIATVGLVSLNAKESQTNQQINSIVPYEDFYRYYIYLTMNSYNDLLNAMASGGTATPNLNTGDFSKIKVLYPDKSLLIKFHDEVEPFFDKIYYNQSQILTLEKLRDTLLPNLMNGEARIVE